MRNKQEEKRRKAKVKQRFLSALCRNLLQLSFFKIIKLLDGNIADEEIFKCQKRRENLQKHCFQTAHRNTESCRHDERVDSK